MSKNSAIQSIAGEFQVQISWFSLRCANLAAELAAAKAERDIAVEENTRLKAEIKPVEQ